MRTTLSVPALLEVRETDHILTLDDHRDEGWVYGGVWHALVLQAEPPKCEAE